VLEEERRQRDDDHEAGDDERQAPDDCAPEAAATRAQKITSWVDAGPGRRLVAATASWKSRALSQRSRSTISSRSSAVARRLPLPATRPHRRRKRSASAASPAKRRQPGASLNLPVETLIEVNQAATPSAA
jgi:hypothetical protein